MYDVSIIIPIYCTTEESLIWLEECIVSALEQDCEVVTCNDGSPISIEPVIRKYSNRLHHCTTEHNGVSSARNTCVIEAKTRLIFPLDCDDRLARDALRKLRSVYDGETPVYPDVRKFGLEDYPHYTLLEFDCEHIIKHVGFTSVNVLHSKEQWKSIGGWNTSIDFYEDGEYNARLFARYCGKRFPEPLVEYRMHENQRTKQYKKRAGTYARNILESIRRLEMPCSSCGKKKTAVSAGAPVASRGIDASVLPGESEGRILVQYIGGKGRGKHYYQGPRTLYPYKVIYGDYLYVDTKDIKRDDTDNSLFVRVEKTAEPAKTAEPLAPAAPKTDVIERTARKDVARIPVLDNIGVAIENLPDISNMTVREVFSMDAVPMDAAKKLIEIEQKGKNRSKVIEYLKGFADG